MDDLGFAIQQIRDYHAKLYKIRPTINELELLSFSCIEFDRSRIIVRVGLNDEPIYCVTIGDTDNSRNCRITRYKVKSSKTLDRIDDSYDEDIDEEYKGY